MGILEELEKIPKKDSDNMWLIKLKAVEELLNNAIETSSSEYLEKATQYLRQVLDLQPSIINTRLNMVTQMIDLSRIREALESIDKKLKNASQFKEGIKELVDLTIQLKATVKKHDQWQQIDNELRRIDGAMTSDDISELEISWLNIKLLTGLQPMSKVDSTFESMMVTQSFLDDMLIHRNVSAVIRCFDTYRKQAEYIFHKVDQELKNLCDNLMKIGEPLASIMQLLAEEE
jgi:tetratricopeptide (TPR) repeat protein